MIYRGEIYWVNLDPTVGSEIKKTRPAIIVSNDTNNQYSDTVTIIPLTSKTDSVHPFEVLIPAKSGGLKTASKAKANQIRTIDKQRLSETPLGAKVEIAILQDLDTAIKIHLDLDII